MAVRNELLLIIVLLVVILILVMAIQFFQPDIEEADASKFVMEDLRSKYPTANISIMSITPKYNEAKIRYFEVKARVTVNPKGPCPERSHIFYNYPAQNFIAQPPEVITRNCVVCAEGICTIAFPEEAIIASHTLEGTEEIASYLETNQNVMPTVIEGTDSWTVVWESQTANYSYSVEMLRDGTILNLSVN